MIGKIGKGKGFAGLTKYILEKESSQLVCSNLAGNTAQEFYRQLGATRQLNPRVRSPVSHISISFAPGEQPESEQLQEIVESTLAGMGLERNLYFAASHNDRHHFHLHIAASRINQDGECVSDWWDKRRLEKVLRSLEAQFDLTPVTCSWEVNRTAPTTGQKRRMMREQREFEQGLRDEPADKSAVEKIQAAIDTAIQPGITMTQFLNHLSQAGVETQVKVTREGIIQGISYSTDGVAFQGSKLGRKASFSCTLQSLQRRGVSFNLERDLEAIALRATSNSQRDTRTERSLISLIQNQPKNLSLTALSTQVENSLANQVTPSPAQHLVDKMLKIAVPTGIALIDRQHEKTGETSFRFQHATLKKQESDLVFTHDKRGELFRVSVSRTKAGKFTYSPVSVRDVQADDIKRWEKVRSALQSEMQKQLCHTVEKKRNWDVELD